MSEELEYADFLESGVYVKKIENQLQQKGNIIKEAKDFINGKNLKENEYRFAEDFNFTKLSEILDKEEK